MLKNLNIKTKLIFTTIFGLTVMSVILGFISVNKGKESLMRKSYDALTSSRDNKAQQIQAFFDETTSNISILAQGLNLEKLLNDTLDAYDEIGTDETKSFDISNSVVIKSKEYHEKFFQNYLKEYSYDDIILIEAETGHVLYTATKKSDYGSNLKFGKLKTSGLAKVWEETLKNKRVTLVDMSSYAPNNNAPSMFIGAPISEYGSVIAVLVFRLSDKSFNSIMQFRKGYGKTQEDYLVGSDYLMRSNSYLDPKGHSLQASFKNPKKGMAKTKASISALKGKVNTEMAENYKGISVLSAYNNIKIGQDFTWAILSEIEEAEVLIIPNELRIQIIIIALVLLVMLSFITYIIINKGIITPLNNFQEGLLNFFKYLNTYIYLLIK